MDTLMRWEPHNNYTSHFNQFFRVMSELESLGVTVPLDFQSLILQSITPPPNGTSQLSMNNLILAESKKTDMFGPRDVQLIINSMSAESGDGTEGNPFQINRIYGNARRGRGGGVLGNGGGRLQRQKGNEGIGGTVVEKSFVLPPGLLYIPVGDVGPNELCNYCGQRGHYKSNCPLKKGQTGVGSGLLKHPGSQNAPAIRLTAPQPGEESIVDTGATQHVSGSSSLFLDLRPLDRSIQLRLASNSSSAVATHYGTIRVPWRRSTIDIENVLYCKEVPNTLLSLGQLIDEGCRVEFRGTGLFLWDGNGFPFFTASLVNRTWVLDGTTVCEPIDTNSPVQVQPCAMTMSKDISK